MEGRMDLVVRRIEPSARRHGISEDRIRFVVLD
jgi:hypothetical protein